MAKILTRKNFSQLISSDSLDIYTIIIEKDDENAYFHVVAYSEELDEKPGFNEPVGMVISACTAYEDLWEAMEEQIEKGMTLYSGPFDDDAAEDLNKAYEDEFLCDDGLIIEVNGTKEALQTLRKLAPFCKSGATVTLVC